MVYLSLRLMSYAAFISHSHTADSSLASALQSALHRFAKPWYKLRALHIFRDQTNLAVNPALWSSIRDALDQSQFLMLLASPEAAASPWVAREAEYWIGRNGPSHLLVVLTGGTLQWDRSAAAFSPAGTNALPPSLLHAFPEEPLFLDLRWARDGAARLRMREPRFHEAVLQLASTLHHRPKDELDGADIRMLRQNRSLAAAVLAAILSIGLFALRQTRLTRKESLQNAAAGLAMESAKLLRDSPSRARETALLAIESNRLQPSFEATQALQSAVSVLPAAAQVYTPDDPNPEQRVRDLAFSPDGANLAAARDDGSVQLLDLGNHKPPVYLMPDEQPVAHIETSGQPPDASPDNPAAVSVAFDSSGWMLASAGRDGIAHVWALPGGRELLRIGNGAPLSQIAWRPGANQVLAAGDDGHVRVFDIPRAAIVADFPCSGKAVSAAFTPAGNLVAALSSTGQVFVFDLAHRKLLHTMPGGETAFNLAISSDGRRLAAAGGDFAFAFDIAAGRQLLQATHAPSAETLTPQQWIVDTAISPDGRFLAYAAKGDNSAHLWNIDTGRQVLELKHDSAVAAVAFAADGSRLGTGSYDGTARVWELPSGHELERVPLAGGAQAVAFSPTGGRFAAGGVNGALSVSEAHRADRPAYFELPSDVRSVAFSPDGRRLAIGAVSLHWSPLVRVAEMAGNTFRDIEFHGAPVIDRLLFADADEVIAQWSDKLFLIGVEHSAVTLLPGIPGQGKLDPSGKLLAVWQPGALNLYALPGLRQVASVAGLASPPRAIGGGGELLAFEENQPPHESLIDVRSVAGNRSVRRIPLPAELTALAFNAPGTILFTAEGQNLQAWEIPSGKRRFSLTATAGIDGILPDPSSAAVATMTHGRLTVWDAVTGARLAQLPDAGYLRAAAFSPDGRYLLAGYDEHFAAVWLWRWTDLRDQACARLTQNLSRDEWARWFPKQPYRATCPGLPAAN